MLNGWKETGTYLGRGVRTVQQYERSHNLPVRRLGGTAGGAVSPKDLDEGERYAETPLRRISMASRRCDGCAWGQKTGAVNRRCHKRALFVRPPSTTKLGYIQDKSCIISRALPAQP